MLKIDKDRNWNIFNEDAESTVVHSHYENGTGSSRSDTREFVGTSTRLFFHDLEKMPIMKQIKEFCEKYHKEGDTLYLRVETEVYCSTIEFDVLEKIKINENTIVEVE